MTQILPQCVCLHKTIESVVYDNIQCHLKRKYIQEVAEVASIHLNLGHERRETYFCHSTYYMPLIIHHICHGCGLAGQ